MRSGSSPPSGTLEIQSPRTGTPLAFDRASNAARSVMGPRIAGAVWLNSRSMHGVQVSFGGADQPNIGSSSTLMQTMVAARR